MPSATEPSTSAPWRSPRQLARRRLDGDSMATRWRGSSACRRTNPARSPLPSSCMERMRSAMSLGDERSWPCPPGAEVANQQGLGYLTAALAARGFVAVAPGINDEFRPAQRRRHPCVRRARRCGGRSRPTRAYHWIALARCDAGRDRLRPHRPARTLTRCRTRGHPRPSNRRTAAQPSGERPRAVGSERRLGRLDPARRPPRCRRHRHLRRRHRRGRRQVRRTLARPRPQDHPGRAGHDRPCDARRDERPTRTGGASSRPTRLRRNPAARTRCPTAALDGARAGGGPGDAWRDFVRCQRDDLRSSAGG